jgi:hypothetical protein
MSLIWLFTEIYLVVGSISAILVLSACIISTRLPEKSPTAPAGAPTRAILTSVARRSQPQGAQVYKPILQTTHSTVISL